MHPCLQLQNDTHFGSKHIHPSLHNSVVTCSLFGKLTFTYLNKKLTALFCSSTFTLNAVMGLHFVPVEAVDILTLIFKIHFNIIFLILLSCYKSSLILRLYGFNSCGRWRCVFGCVFPLTLQQKKQPQARRPDLFNLYCLHFYLLTLLMPVQPLFPRHFFSVFPSICSFPWKVYR